MPPSFAEVVFQYLYESDKQAYRAGMNILATRRKLRPVILERKSRAERHAWMGGELARKSNEDAATEILQAWLLGAHQQMICDFLDALKVPHNGHGLVDDLPTEPTEEAIRAAVEGLLSKYPQEAVAAYLNLFVEMDIAQWPRLKELVSTDARLSLAPETATA